MLLENGSNLLVRDSRFYGAIIQIADNMSDWEINGQKSESPGRDKNCPDFSKLSLQKWF
jgi:hypothetical protein